MIFRTTLNMPPKSRLHGHYSLSWYENIDLDEIYPISFAFVLQHSLPFLFSYLVLIFLITLSRLDLLPVGISTLLGAYGIYILVLGAFMLLAVMGFWEVYRRSIDIQIEGMRLNITKGIFKKTTGALVLRAHNVVYLYQNPLDLLFGVYQLQVCGSNLPKTEYAHIPALVADDAFDLFRFLADEFSSQVSIPGAELDD
jgi:hypothetical protein